jgi:hypothetical protein
MIAVSLGRAAAAPPPAQPACPAECDAESFLAEDTLISGRDASQTHHPVRPKRLSSSGDLPRADLGCGRSGIGRGISDGIFVRAPGPFHQFRSGWLCYFCYSSHDGGLRHIHIPQLSMIDGHISLSIPSIVLACFATNGLANLAVALLFKLLHSMLLIIDHGRRKWHGSRHSQVRE